VLTRVSLLVASFIALQTTAPPIDLGTRAHQALAQIDGEIAVAGLRAPVEVIRDTWGVPHIFARNQHDLFFAQGFVAAQDRLWQLDMWRRAAEGKLSEVLGPRALDRDTFARLLRYRGDLGAEWNSYAPDAREIAAAFVEGVNAQIDLVNAHPGKLPIEFAMTGGRPDRWTIDVVIGRLAGYVMTGNASRELRRALLAKSVGVPRTLDIMPIEPRVDLELPDGLDLSDLNPDILKVTRDADAPFAFEDPSQIGSNDWVVSGEHTASGRPLLANDPHRAIRIPSLRYSVHLNAPGWNVIGAGEPALPGIAAGHNDRIAFGFTIVGMDQQDLYVEKLHPTDDRLYLVNGAWEPIREIQERIAVKGQKAPQTITLRFTRHGPVVATDSGRRRAFALRWVGMEPGTAGYLASLTLDRVKNWPEFLAAAHRWKVPAENIVYADVDGNIGWIAAGLAPLRARGTGLLPAPGHDSAYEWAGFLPVSDLPQSFNPSSGYIATANHNILPPHYPHMLGYEWGAPHRYRRIVEMLESGRKFTVTDFEQMQHDVVSLPARQIVSWLNQALSFPGVQPEAESVYATELLKDWDARLSADSAAAAMYETWLPFLGKAAISAAVPPAERQHYDPNSIDTTLRLLAGLDPARRAWVMTGASLVDAWYAGAATLGDDETKWAWGRLHQSHFEHPLATTPERRALLNLGPQPRGGDGTTPFATGTGRWQTHGASFREVIDLADWDRSTTINVPGESGQPGSPYYGNLYSLWAEGKYHPMLFSRAAIEKNAAHRLTLTPRLTRTAERAEGPRRAEARRR
jgi:penicillin amidase